MLSVQDWKTKLMLMTFDCGLAAFQTVSCLQHGSHAFSWGRHACLCRGSQGLLVCYLVPSHLEAGSCALHSSIIESWQHM